MMEDVNILAVDDVPENLVALAALLKRPGIRLIQARSGREALEALLVHDTALALLDVNMPEMDGFELAELMRGTERTRQVPIIFLTAAVPERRNVFQGYEAGAVDFLFKPLDPQLLISKVEVFAQLHRQKLQLAEQFEQIKHAQAMSDLFVGVLGHDLRNPLSNIINSAALLELKPADAEATLRRVAVIQRATTRMGRLIQQVLDFALARVKGGIPIRADETELAPLVKQVVADLEPALVARVEVEVFGETRGTWDSDRMTQVITNLISNALEHGECDAPIRVRLDGSASDAVLLEVANRGVVKRVKLDEIFSPYKPRSEHTSGLGLGLYIVDQIVRAHGGDVSVVSDELQGTTFRIRLPRTPSSVLASSHRRSSVA